MFRESNATARVELGKLSSTGASALTVRGQKPKKSSSSIKPESRRERRAIMQSEGLIIKQAYEVSGASQLKKGNRGC